jgi:hypothetical protein
MEVSALRSYSLLWGKCPAVAERDKYRKVDWSLWADCVAFPVTGSLSIRYWPVGTREGAVLARSTEHHVARFQASMTTVDANLMKQVRETDVCLETDGSHIRQLPYEAHMP